MKQEKRIVTGELNDDKKRNGVESGVVYRVIHIQTPAHRAATPIYTIVSAETRLTVCSKAPAIASMAELQAAKLQL